MNSGVIHLTCLSITLVYDLDWLDDSHMPIGWLLFIDGAVGQCCVHRKATVQELEDRLQAYDIKRN